MAEASLITQIADWLVDQSLGEPDMVELFEGACHRLYAIGVPVSRANLMWSTLHPLFRAENVLWRRGQPAEFGQFRHEDSVTDEWIRSPMHHMLKENVTILRRRLAGPAAVLDFEITKELAKEGYTDYLVMGTDLFSGRSFSNAQRRGIFITWASDRPAGFVEDDLAALQRIQRRLAVACKTVIQARISRNIAEAYLGRETGRRVLAGSIRLGDGEQTRALVWYSDLRSSTRLAETMPNGDFLELLNVYFECAARPAINAGGEVLAFIGDAVLAIFPVENDAELPMLSRQVTTAITEFARTFQPHQRGARRGGSRADPLRYRAECRKRHVRKYRRAGAARLLGDRPDRDRGRAHREADQGGRRARAGDAPDSHRSSRISGAPWACTGWKASASRRSFSDSARMPRARRRSAVHLPGKSLRPAPALHADSADRRA